MNLRDPSGWQSAWKAVKISIAEAAYIKRRVFIWRRE
jgi:hypothetical protein